MFRKNSQHVIALGFGLVLVLLLSVTALGLIQMRDVNKRLQNIILQNSLQSDLVFTMHYAARERALLLFSMALTHDPFVREDNYTRFNQMATDFADARERLLQMPLSQKERAILVLQGKLISTSMPLQQHVADLLMENNVKVADSLLLTKAVPAQTKVLEQLGQLIDLQKEIARATVATAARSARYAYIYTMTIGALAVLLCTLVAISVIRRVKRAEDALFREKELAEITPHSIGDAVITANVEGNVEYINPIAEKMTGWTAATAERLPLADVLHIIDEVSRAPIGIQRLLDDPTGGIPGHCILRHKDSREFIIETSCSPILGRADRAMGSVLVFRDVTQARSLAQQLNWQARHDSLTGLANRYEFEHQLGKLLESAQMLEKHHALLYIDMDQFKLVNDTCGHVAGDELLRQIAIILGARLREADTLARLGGDEFGVLLEGCPEEQAQRIAASLLDAVHDFRFAWLDKIFEVGLSIGLVSIGPEDRDLDRILSAADEACYTAKDNGRNRVHLYRSDDQDLLQRRGQMHWATRISSALEQKRFRLFYQAISPLSSEDSAEHYEILLRMVDENNNLISPMAFIPAAERYHMMSSIDRWVIRSLFSTQGPFLRQGRDGRQPHTKAPLCAINLSGTAVGDDAFLDYVQEQISQYNIPPSALCFEITETAAITNLNKASRFMHELRSLGCHFALDDFGSGMSSFAYLKHLPVDYLKIDGSFVRDIVRDPVDFALVEAINRIGHVLGMRTIAESAESEAILEKLRDLGVDYVQGNAIHVPELLTEFPAMTSRADAPKFFSR